MSDMFHLYLKTQELFGLCGKRGYNSIPFPTIPTGVTNLLTYFTNSQLNDEFNNKTEEFYETLQADYRNPDRFTEPVSNANYFINLKQSTTDAVTPLVNLFIQPDGILEKYRNIQQKENAWELDIADIFYTPANNTYSAPLLSLEAICIRIYNDPTKYLRLLQIYNSTNTLWELAKYKKCIPVDIRNRPSKNVLRSRFAR